MRDLTFFVSAIAGGQAGGGHEQDTQHESSMERVTATFDAETLAAIRKVAGPRGVSAFLQAAARERLARLQVVELLEELDAEHGAPTASVVEQVATDARAIFASPATSARRRGARR